MKYMILTYLDEKAWLALSPEQQQAEMELCGPHVQQLIASKKLVDGAPLHPTATATTLRYRDGKRLVTDGPFAETREQLGGYTIIEADNLDEALAAAKGFLMPSAVPCTLELRPIVELSEMPGAKAEKR
ncbi:MAG TPA: YciI family protein [Polyangiaceae bacterium]|nr:YciI family protein [Polyangiaceae bacterium]